VSSAVGGREDDIRPDDLFAGSDFVSIQGLADVVQTAYVTDACWVVVIAADGTPKNELHSPQWALNKMLAHPTQRRGSTFDDGPFVDIVLPKLKLLTDKIGELQKAQGREFPPLP
jgi:hypothetical protein